MTPTKELAPRSYDAGIIKRSRATRVELEHRRTSLVELARAAQPATVRNIYYRAVVAGLVEKKETGYVKVQRDLVKLRQSGHIPYSWIEDTGRRAHYPLVDRSASSALRWCASSYRRNPWQDFEAPTVEIWCESRSIAGTLRELVDTYAVPVFPCGGQTSDSFAYEAARTYLPSRPVVVLYAGDYDPAGLEAASQLEGKLRQHAAAAHIEFRKLSITDEQAAVPQMQVLGTAPKKRRWRGFDGQHHEFVGQSIELEAVDPVLLRQMFAQAVENIAFEYAGYDIFEENRRLELDDRERLTVVAEEWDR